MRLASDMLTNATETIELQLGPGWWIITMNISYAGSQEVDVDSQEVIDLGRRREQGYSGQLVCSC